MGEIIDINEVIRKCEALADSEYRKNVGREIPTDWRIIGVRTPLMREFAKEYFSMVESEEDFSSLLRYLDRAFEKRTIEPISLGLSIIDKKKKYLNRGALDHVKKWAHVISDWAVCDGIGMVVLSNLLVEEKITIEDLKFLKNHENVFGRRLYIVSLILPLREGTDLFDRCLEEIADLVDDHDKYINKAISWMLRTGVKSNSKKIAKFLEDHRENLHSSIIREVERKIKTGRKSG